MLIVYTESETKDERCRKVASAAFWACLLACIQRNGAFGQQEDGNCTSNDFLNVASNDGNFNHDPHQQSGGLGILSSAKTTSWLLSVQNGTAVAYMLFC